MKRFTILFTLLLALFLLVGCGGTAEEPATVEEPAAVEPVAEEPVAEEETAVEAPATEAAKEEPASETSDGLILATTTSTENSGLLAAILPLFEAEAGVPVNVIAVGTGQALQLGEDGNADVLLVHARAREDAFMDAGHGNRREDVMYNDFIIVGPANDPAGIQGKNNVAKAFGMIAEGSGDFVFVSRGDDSGTHTKELAIWEAAGIEPDGEWYISAGQGMGAVLTMADERQAYTLTDRATYLARTLEGTDLEIMVEGDPILFNPYGVMAVNPNKGDHIQADLATQFIDWLVSVPTQEVIGEFGTAEFGAPLFVPDSQPWNETQGTAVEDDGGEEAMRMNAEVALAMTGLVTDEMGWSELEIFEMNTIEAESTNSKGEPDTYTGVPINDLLAKAGVQDGATTLVFTADDGSTAAAVLADIQACDDCIVSFRNNGGFSIVLPGFDKSSEVKGVVVIEVK